MELSSFIGKQFNFTFYRRAKFYYWLDISLHTYNNHIIISTKIPCLSRRFRPPFRIQKKMENFLTWGCLVAIIVFQNKLFHFLNSYQIWSINSAIWGVKVSPSNKYFWSFEHLSLNILPDQGIQIFLVERNREKLSGTVEQCCHPLSRWDKCECDLVRYGQTSSKLSSHWSSSVVKRICSRYWNLPLRL